MMKMTESCANKLTVFRGRSRSGSIKLIMTSFLFAFSISLVTAAERPNIIVVLSDDMGYTDLGCYGGEINTPNIDALANDGVRFTQFYNAGRCCPTRASLLTGLYPHQTGLGHMTDDRGIDGYRGGIDQNCVTIGEVLQSKGYSTYVLGKWHVTLKDDMVDTKEARKNWPLQRGFDRYYGTLGGANSYYDPSVLTRGNTLISPFADAKYKPESYYYTDAITDNAMMFIEEHKKEKPFFMYVSYTAPHWPLHALPEDIAKYKGKYDSGYDPIREARYKKALELGVIEKSTKLSPLNGANWNGWGKQRDKEWESACMEVYAAMVDRMDQGIGKIVKKLKSKNMLDNTLIVYLHDNGGCPEKAGRNQKGNAKGRAKNEIKYSQVKKQPAMKAEDCQPYGAPKITRDGSPVRKGHVMPGPANTYIGYGKNWANVSNTPFQMFKGFVHEGGISTPLIAHWPRGIKAKGEIRHTPGHLIDLMATFVDISGATYPTTYKDHPIKPMEGKSLVPVFDDKPIDREYLLWDHNGNRAIRVGDWKLVNRNKPYKWEVRPKFELYNLAEDRSEMNDLIESYPEKAKELQELFEKQGKRVNILPYPGNRRSY